MATEKIEKKGYPLIPVKQWAKLRGQFKKTMPGTASAKYLASVLSMTEQSARNNILPSLRAMKLLDADEKPTALAIKWRDDAQYPKVCETIRTAVYPQELRDIGSSAADKDGISRWFANHTGAGDNAVRKMTAVYLMLCEADAAKLPAASNDKPAKQARGEKSKKPTEPRKKEPREEDEPAKPKERPLVAPLAAPPMHINVQVHISSDATPDQIDKIFSSMAKHLYSRD